MRWPGVSERLVTLGGVTCTCAQARQAVEFLEASGASAIRSVLAARGNPLGGCDYWAVCGPYLERARADLALKTEDGRRCIGPKGRHLAKYAFGLAVRAALAAAARAEQAAAFAALATDERYAAAVAADAVQLRQRAHTASLRARVRAAVAAATARCAREGSGTCALTAACGTGQCPFAPEFLRGASVPAPLGRILRPPAHVSRGGGFSDAAAVAWLAAAEPWHAAVDVADHDAGGCTDDVAA